MKHFRTWSLLFRVLCACVVGVRTCPLSWRMGKDHAESCLQGPQMIPINVSSCKWVLWLYKPQILLSHLGVTCLPRRCQSCVTCYTALVSVNCTSQVRQGWQGYYNIWCDVAFYYHHLTLSSFPKLWEWERCYMVHMTGLYFRVWRKKYIHALYL